MLAGALLFRGDLDAAAAPIDREMMSHPDLLEDQHAMAMYHFLRERLPAALEKFGVSL